MRTHIVQKGDTLWKIAKQYAVGFDELKRLNAHLANPDYIVPGMEIYLPALPKEKEKAIVKEKLIQQPAPTPTPVPKEQIKPVGPPTWQGDLYFQPQMPAPQVPMPQWQHTHVHVEPTIEQTMLMPQMPMPQMPQMPQMPMPMPQMMPMPMPMHPMCMPQPSPPQMMPYPIPICMCCHGVRMDEHTMIAPIQREESSTVPKQCLENDARVQQYYEEIQQIQQQPRCCKPPQMQPYQMPMPMHPMHCLPPWHM